jgi:hypothetical protein
MYRRSVVAVILVAGATALCAQPPPAAPADLLPRFRMWLKHALGRLPDYTCIETIARARRTPPSTHFQPLDTIRVQVGLIGGRESYAWPDAAPFYDRELRELVGRRIISAGDFAGHVHHVFLSPATQFTPHGTGALRERAAARLRFGHRSKRLSAANELEK